MTSVHRQGWYSYSGRTTPDSVILPRTKFVVFLSADNDTSPVAAAMSNCWLLLTGLRRDELRLAKWEHVDPVKRTLWFLKPRMAMDGLFTLIHWRWT